jgi:hypothetical protein
VLIQVATTAMTAVLGVAAPTAAGAELGCLPGRPAALLVAYTRTGGLAGIRDELRIYRGGQATLARARGRSSTLRLICARVRAVSDALRRARFGTLAPVYAPADPFADGFTETVAYAGRRPTVLPGARPPERLARVLGLLRNIVATRRLKPLAAG